MKSATIACVVEGHGDMTAVPILIRRIVTELSPQTLLSVPDPPVRVPRAKLARPNVLENAVELAARAAGPRAGVLVLVDADDDCPKARAPGLLARVKAQRSDRPVAVVLANRGYEAWLLAAATSLQGKQGLSADLRPPEIPEDVRGAKEWLRQHMAPGRKYSETVDQRALTRCFDLQAARKAPSFDKLWREIRHMLIELGCEVTEARP